MKIDPRLPCKDCDCQTVGHDYYMVYDKIWCEAHGYKSVKPRVASRTESLRGFLCFKCLARRLGRPIYREDFMPVPINNGIKERFPSIRSLKDDKQPIGAYTTH